MVCGKWVWFMHDSQIETGFSVWVNESCHIANVAMQGLALWRTTSCQCYLSPAVSNNRDPCNLLHWKMLSIQLVLGLPLILNPSVNPVIAACSVESFGWRRMWQKYFILRAFTWCRSTDVVPAFDTLLWWWAYVSNWVLWMNVVPVHSDNPGLNRVKWACCCFMQLFWQLMRIYTENIPFLVVDIGRWMPTKMSLWCVLYRSDLRPRVVYFTTDKMCRSAGTDTGHRQHSFLSCN